MLAYTLAYLTWQIRSLPTLSLMSHNLNADSMILKEDIIKHFMGNAMVNKSTVPKSESMVRTEYHAQQPKTSRSSINNAQPLKGEKGKEGEREATGRDSQGPEGVTLKIVFEVILLLLTTKNAWQ